MLRRLAWFILALLAVGAGAYWWVEVRPLPLPRPTFELSVRSGATLRSVARDLTAAGILPADWTLVALARFTRSDRMIKAGNYEIAPGTTLAGLLAKLTQGDALQTGLTIVEGWSFRDLRAALAANEHVVKTALDLPDEELMRTIGAKESSPEGLFFPDTYFFAAGTNDVSVLSRAYHIMQERLTAAWNARAPDLPVATPYEALILASLVEKETGRPEDRPLVASVFINRLKAGMRLQTDPSVIYGLAERWEGNLTRRHLESDGRFNTYTREGLPPTPIAMPGQAALDASLHPATTPYLYFVARGDGSSEFSINLADHNRAVAKYLRSR